MLFLAYLFWLIVTATGGKSFERQKCERAEREVKVEAEAKAKAEAEAKSKASPLKQIEQKAASTWMEVMIPFSIPAYYNLGYPCLNLIYAWIGLRCS